MRIIKGKGIYFTEEEYALIAKDTEGRYYMPFVKKEIADELEKNVIIALKNNETKSGICERFNLLDTDLTSWFKKTYETVKITEVRQKLSF